MLSLNIMWLLWETKLWLKILLNGIIVAVNIPVKMYCDNKVAINLSNNPVRHDRMKYVDINFHFIYKKINLKGVGFTGLRIEWYIFYKKIIHRWFWKKCAQVRHVCYISQLERSAMSFFYMWIGLEACQNPFLPLSLRPSYAVVSPFIFANWWKLLPSSYRKLIMVFPL